MGNNDDLDDADDLRALLGPDGLPASSSLLSSRWSRDNLITSHPGVRYTARIVERVDAAALAALAQELEATRGPVELGAARLGAVTWDVNCVGANGPFVLQVPIALDDVDPADGVFPADAPRGGRARRDVPRLCVENARHYLGQGLRRYLPAPLDLVTLGARVPAAIFAAWPGHHPLSFGRGSLHVELVEGRLSWTISLGAPLTAELLVEMIAALTYHYEPARDGGTALGDVFINDGDFVIRRKPDGAFDVRMTAARRRLPGVGPRLLLLDLVQMVAFEDWAVDGGLIGLPALASNPSVALEGVVRGRRAHARDLGRPEEEGAAEALSWIADFGASPEGRAYQPWVERFLAGRLPPAFGADPREHGWRLTPLRERHGVLALRARLAPDPSVAASARAVETVIDRLSREVGRPPDDDEPGKVRINDADRGALLALLEEAGLPAPARDGVAAELFERWPYRGLDHLIARVPAARPLRRHEARLTFGRVVRDDDHATLASLAPLPKGPGGTTFAGWPRPLANAELFVGDLGGRVLPSDRAAAAVRAFPTFEAYMDAALHDEVWGYYARRVVIGRDGDFDTSPESLSPHFGRWMAAWAFRCWQDMVAHGELAESDPFPVVELGAGNGRLARDFLDAIDAPAAAPPGAARPPDRAARAAWQTFAARVAYRIYETSASLRAKQSALLGTRAVVAEGDARRPGAVLARDFPDGLRGFVLTNEVPDAFGVHKVVLTREGRVFAALVVPRLAAGARVALGEALAGRIAAADAAVRGAFGFTDHPGDPILDAPMFAAVMDAAAGAPPDGAAAVRAALWFEEVYVPAAAIPELAAHLRARAGEYATALAAEDSGVVIYVNLHATRFIHELGSSLRAGFIFTIDYGDTTWGLIQGARRGGHPFRVYGGGPDGVPRPNDPYTAPGTQDMTTDVDFTELALAGQGAGLTALHYGPERDVSGEELSAVLAAADDQEPFAQLLGNPVFRLLVLGRRPTALFDAPSLTTLPLGSREQDVPKARRPAIAALRAALSSL